jgi:hypothetical protein
VNELRGAYRRYARAGEHLADLEGVITRIRDLCENGVLAEEDPETLAWHPSVSLLTPLQLDAGVLVGEIAHNLRASLDYLVYVLAEADSGSPQENTQFLIEDHAQGFTGRSPAKLKGLSEEHVAIVRQFQPFKGSEWTGILRDIDNAAKHREIVSVSIDQSVGGALLLSEYAVGGQLDADGNPVAKSVNMYLKGAAQILLPDGRPVVETLKQLQTQVAFVLGLFAYEFPAG